MNFNTLKSLIDYLDQFEQETRKTDLPSFIVWMYELLVEDPSFFEMGIKDSEALGSDMDLNAGLSFSINALYQFMKHYVKKAVQELPLKGLNDYNFLEILEKEGPHKKSDIIQKNFLEFSRGWK